MGKTLTRQGHPGFDGLPPLCILGGLFMCGGRFVGRIGFILRESLRVIPVLQDIKTEISRFLDRVLMVLKGCGNKLINIFRPNENMDNGNDHKSPPA